MYKINNNIQCKYMNISTQATKIYIQKHKNINVNLDNVYKECISINNANIAAYTLHTVTMYGNNNNNKR